MKIRDAILLALIVPSFAFALACGGSNNAGNMQDASFEPDARFPDARVPDASEDATVNDDGGTSEANQFLAECTEAVATECTDFPVTRAIPRAQGFSPSVDGELTAVSLLGANEVVDAGATAELIIVSADGMGPEAITSPQFDIPTHTIATVEVPFTEATGWVEVAIDSAPEVVADGDYFLILRQVGTDPSIACEHESCVMGEFTCECASVTWSGYNDSEGGSDPYGRGTFFRRYMNLWQAQDSAQDVSFEIYVVPAE